MNTQKKLIEQTDSNSKNRNFLPQHEGITALDELRGFETIVDRLRRMDWDFENEDTTDLTHDIHPYTAKFIPQIPRQLILYFSIPGERVWDPFSGSGTTAVEALRLNRSVICTDKNPLASIIGRTKVTPLSEEVRKELHKLLDSISIPCRGEINGTDNYNISSSTPLEKWISEVLPFLKCA